MPGVPGYHLPWPDRRRRVTARRLLIEAHRPRSFDAAEWREALVVVERGGLELEWRDGARLALQLHAPCAHPRPRGLAPGRRRV